MAEGSTQPAQVEDNTVEPASQQGATGERTFTQAEVNEIIERRVARVKATPPADYDELKAKVAATSDYDDLKAAATSDYDDLKAEVEALKAEKAKAAEVAKAAKEHGVDADLLARMAGDVEENAQYLASLPRYRPVPDQGGVAGAGAGVVTRDSIEATKDPVERIRLRAQHQNLYK